jgi:hypothetical protein
MQLARAAPPRARATRERRERRSERTWRGRRRAARLHGARTACAMIAAVAIDSPNAMQQQLRSAVTRRDRGPAAVSSEYRYISHSTNQYVDSITVYEPALCCRRCVRDSTEPKSVGNRRGSHACGRTTLIISIQGVPYASRPVLTSRSGGGLTALPSRHRHAARPQHRRARPVAPA